MWYSPPVGKSICFDLNTRPAATANFELVAGEVANFDLGVSFVPLGNAIWFELADDTIHFVADFLPLSAKTHLQKVVIQAGEIHLQGLRAGTSISSPKVVQLVNFGFAQVYCPVAGNKVDFELVLEDRTQEIVFNSQALKDLTQLGQTVLGILTNFSAQSLKAKTFLRADVRRLYTVCLKSASAQTDLLADIRRVYVLGLKRLSAETCLPVFKIYTDPVVWFNQLSPACSKSHFSVERLPDWYKPYRKQGMPTIVWQRAKKRDVKKHLLFKEANRTEDIRRQIAFEMADRKDVKKDLCAKGFKAEDKSSLFVFEAFTGIDKFLTVRALRGVANESFYMLGWQDLPLVDVMRYLEAKIGMPLDRIFEVDFEKGEDLDRFFYFIAKNAKRLDVEKEISWGEKYFVRPCRWYPILPARGDKVNFEMQEPAPNWMPNKIRKLKHGRFQCPEIAS